MAPSTENKRKHSKPRTPARTKHSILVALFFAVSFLLLFRRRPQTNPVSETDAPAIPALSCLTREFVYVYDLPSKFNFGLLADCRRLNIYTDMCPHVANRGLGQPVPPVLGPGQWHATHQFIGEMIFHARMERHPCRTNDPARARLFYVPFYGGLHASSMFREKDLRVRDDLAVQLARHLEGSPWWRRHGGRDHFLALGRTAWDFLRKSNQGPDFGANILLDLAPIMNMSVLTVERQPWQGSNQFGMPYPSYFHPTKLDQMLAWQDKVRQSDRPYLFSFIGGPRKGLEKAAVRGELIDQCAESSQCRLMKCVGGDSKCHSPVEILKAMMGSKFCLQAPGDSFTRRSTFDSILAGCIPVFFSRHTAYTQYMWFLPEDHNEYSVFIDADKPGALGMKIEDVLSKITEERVEKMRTRVIELIPRLTYAHPNATNLGFKDAVDVAVEALIRHVKSGLSSSQQVNNKNAQTSL